MRSAPRPLSLAVGLAAVLTVGLAVVAPLVARAAAAQPAPASRVTPPAGPPEVLRGRVLDDSARALPGAAVHVTRGPDRLTQQTTTDSTGRWSLRFDPGTGDYLVAVSAPGFRTGRRRVQRVGAERELVADFTLARDLSMLAAVQVRAKRPERADNYPDRYGNESGGAERFQDGVQGQVSPTLAGDLAATAATIPGLTLTPSGVAVLGLDPSSNLTTLNGMALPLGQLPRAARLDTRVASATFDPTRGGFAGANIDVRLAAGDRDFQRRNGFLTLVPAPLQVTDAVGRATGAQLGQFRGSLGADGELIRRAVTYNVALDVARDATEPASLLTADAATLLRGGVAPDTVARLVGVASPLGIPIGAGGVPGAQRRDAVTWLGRLDDTRDSLRSRTFTSYAGWTRSGALGLAPLAAPSTASRRTERTAGGQLVFRDFVGPGRRVLTETRLSGSGVWTRDEPYRALPSASVFVRSPTVDAQRDVAALALGGSPVPPRDASRWTAEAMNETIWMASGRMHRFKASLWGRADGLREDPSGTLLGRWSFNSLDDLAANRPASFSRTLTAPERTGTAWNAAGALAHQWNVSRTFQLLYGARVEAGGFGTAPAPNAALAQALGVATGVAPARVHVSPRASFSWTYNRARNNGGLRLQTQYGRFDRGPAGTLRGGIGEFRDLVQPVTLADLRAATGLPGGLVTLSCVGAAAPVPDWSRLLQSPDAIPGACAGATTPGFGVLAERAPNVTVLGRKWNVPRSWRASLDWTTTVGGALLRANALGSYDLNQRGFVDANFAGRPGLALGAAEGARPVFVPAGGIDAATGAVSPAASRVTDAFGRVGVLANDLRGYGGQLTVQLQPSLQRLAGRFRGLGQRWPIYTEIAYTLQATRRQFRGFDGAAFGDPREREWAPGPNDARHAVVAQLGTTRAWLGTVTLFGRFQSGLPYTPLVQGDVNGDGRPLDRAFVPDASGNGDPALAAQLAALRDDGAPGARDCLRRFTGQVAARNGCRGPWTQTLNLQWTPPIPKRWTGRATARVFVENLGAGVDRLLHGEDGLRGWGVAAPPDPILLVPRGFDATAPGGPRFRYDVNPRFGDTRAARTLLRAPMRVTLDVSLDLGVPYPVQQLRRALEPVRAPDRTWQRRSADSIAAYYLEFTTSIARSILAESDSLLLTPAQVAALRDADAEFGAEVRTMYRSLGAYLATRGAPGKLELDSAKAVERAYYRAAWRQIDLIDSVLTPVQMDLVPFIRSLARTTPQARETMTWMIGGYEVPLVDPKQKPTAAAPAAAAAPARDERQVRRP